MDIPRIAPEPVASLARQLLDCVSDIEVLNLTVNLDDADLLEAATQLAHDEGLLSAYSLIAQDRVAIIRRPGADEPTHLDLIRSLTHNLDVTLTEDEKNTAAGHVVELTDEIDALKVQAKCAADNFKAHIQIKEAERSAEATKWRTGKERRAVVCDIVFDIAADKVNTIRTDTGEVIDTRAPSDDERQRPLPFAKANVDEPEDGEPAPEPPKSRGRKGRERVH